MNVFKAGSRVLQLGEQAGRERGSYTEMGERPDRVVVSLVVRAAVEDDWMKGLCNCQGGA